MVRSNDINTLFSQTRWDPHPLEKMVRSAKKIVPLEKNTHTILSLPAEKHEIFKSPLKNFNCIFSIHIESFELKTMKSPVLKTTTISFPIEFKLSFFNSHWLGKSYRICEKGVYININHSSEAG